MSGVLRKAASEAAANAAKRIQWAGRTRKNQDQRSRIEQQIESVRRAPQLGRLPFDEVGGHGAAAVGEDRGHHAETVRVEAGDGNRQRRDQPEAAAIGRGGSAARQNGFHAVGQQHQPAQQEAAVAIGPEERQRRQRPPSAAQLQQADEDRYAQEADHSGTIGREGRHHRCRGTRGGDSGIDAPRQARGEETGEGAEQREQDGSREDDAGEAGHRVHRVHQKLAQPLVGQVEVAHL